MSIRGLIAIMDDDGSCSSICVHNGMNEANAGSILRRHYATRELAERLLARGNLSLLGSTPESCVLCGEKRLVESQCPTPWSDCWQLAREAYGRFLANYSYLFMDGSWHVSDGGPWVPVESW